MNLLKHITKSVVINIAVTVIVIASGHAIFYLLA